MDRFLREPEQEKVTGLSRTSRWRLEREGKFPKSYSIGGGNAKGRLESEIREWMAQIVGGANNQSQNEAEAEDDEAAQVQAEAEDDEAAQAEAQRHEDDEDEEAEAESLKAA